VNAWRAVTFGCLFISAGIFHPPYSPLAAIFAFMAGFNDVSVPRRCFRSYNNGDAAVPGVVVLRLVSSRHRGDERSCAKTAR